MWLGRRVNVRQLLLGLRVQRAVVAAVVTVLVVGGFPSYATAHTIPPGCLTVANDYTCKAHWASYHTKYHYSGAITSSANSSFRSRFVDAANTWINATNPNSVWHVHTDASSPIHVGLVNASGSVLGYARPANPSKANCDPPATGSACHIPDAKNSSYSSTIQIWLRLDITEVTSCGGPCSWYTGTGTPGGSQLDAISVWMEELGHVQNMTHYVTPGHGGHSHQHTMSGMTVPGSTTKRILYVHERQHACDPYGATHGKPC